MQHIDRLDEGGVVFRSGLFHNATEDLACVVDHVRNTHIIEELMLDDVPEEEGKRSGELRQRFIPARGADLVQAPSVGERGVEQPMPDPLDAITAECTLPQFLECRAELVERLKDLPCDRAVRLFLRRGRLSVVRAGTREEETMEFIDLKIEKRFKRGTRPSSLRPFGVPEEPKGDPVPPMDGIQPFQGAVEVVGGGDLVSQFPHHVPLNTLPLFHKAMLEAAEKLNGIAVSEGHWLAVEES